MQDVFFVLIALVSLFLLVYAMVVGSWLDVLVSSLLEVFIFLIFAFMVIPWYRRELLDKAARRSSSTPTTSDLNTNLLPPAAYFIV
jgi:Kef-type K+ transport system membrane component KefB